MGLQRRVRSERRLRAKDVASLEPGTHEDGGGLRLVVEPGGARRWVLRVTIAGTRRNRGLGSYPLVSLDKARDAAIDIRRAARAGRDLAEDQRRERAKAVTFRQAFDIHFEQRKQHLGNAKHLAQWPSTMEVLRLPAHRGHCRERRHPRPHPRHPRADMARQAGNGERVLQRMEAVFKSAILRGQREKASPCIGIAQELGTSHRDVRHHRALPYAEVPAFLQTLRGCRAEVGTRLCFEWTILTAARSSEARGARWREIDEKRAWWVIPRERMKAGVEHVVPLSDRCLEIVWEARRHVADSELLFPSPRTGGALAT